MGSGRNGTFDKRPDFNQWAVLVTGCQIPVTGNDSSTLVDGNPSAANSLLPRFIQKWLSLFHCKNKIYILKPIEGHGLWDGKEVFGQLPKQSLYEGKIAVLTRATIRVSRLKNFWKHVDAVAAQMSTANGFIESYGIGEVPWIKQATFSVWESKEQMKAFAYRMKEHAEVIKKTRQEKWYSEDMFVRFEVVSAV